VDPWTEGLWEPLGALVASLTPGGVSSRAAEAGSRWEDRGGARDPGCGGLWCGGGGWFAAGRGCEDRGSSWLFQLLLFSVVSGARGVRGVCCVVHAAAASILLTAGVLCLAPLLPRAPHSSLPLPSGPPPHHQSRRAAAALQACWTPSQPPPWTTPLQQQQRVQLVVCLPGVPWWRWSCRRRPLRRRKVRRWGWVLRGVGLCNAVQCEGKGCVYMSMLQAAVSSPSVALSWMYNSP
jgi:hypothetical protein